MLATLSPEAQVARILDEIGCVPTNFTDIADRHANSRVIAALKGTNDFDREDGQYYLGLARQMKKLAEEYHPIPIDWRKTQTIKDILAARRTQARPVPFAVIIVGQQLFKRISSGQVETTTTYRDCAAFSDELVARTAAKIINDMVSEPLRTTLITNERRPPESIFGQLSDFGFQQ